MEKEETWTIVSSKKKGKRFPSNFTPQAKTGKNIRSSSSNSISNSSSKHQKPGQDSSNNSNLFAFSPPTKSTQEVLVDLEQCKSQLKKSHYFQAFLKVFSSSSLEDELRQIEHIEGLGIGSFAQSTNALTQLALLLLLRDHLLSLSQCSGLTVSLYDPMMQDVDRQVCAALQLDVEDLNRHGRYASISTSSSILPEESKSTLSSSSSCAGQQVTNADERGRILYFMPHCPYRLYCNVLWHHWRDLSQVIILGNSFASYRERRLGVMQEKTDSVARLTPFVTELSLWPLLRKADLVADHNQGLAVEGAFCDLGLMYLAGPLLGSEGLDQAALERLLREDVPSEEEIEAAGRADPELW